MMSEHTNCIHEEQLSGQSRKLAELEAHINYKDKRIDELIKDQKSMENKIDKIADNVNSLMLKSVQDDNNLNQRVTALESSQDTIYKFLSVITVIFMILTFYFNFIK